MICDSDLAREFWELGKSDSCPIYDMHGHMGRWQGIYFPRAETEQMIGTMDECGVRLLVFSHHDALLAPDIGNRSAVEAVRKYPDRLRAYCVVNPNYPDRAMADIVTYEQNRDAYVGLKFLPDYHGLPLTHGDYRAAWEFAAEGELLVLTHTWKDSELDGPATIRTVAERYPRVKLLLGHSCHGDWDAAVSLARDFPNIYLELTAVFDDRGVIEKFAGEVGSHRMLFGTDLPWFDPHHAIGVLLSAAISDEDRHNICHRNAETLLEPFLRANMLEEAIHDHETS